MAELLAEKMVEKTVGNWAANSVATWVDPTVYLLAGHWASHSAATWARPTAEMMAELKGKQLAA